MVPSVAGVKSWVSLSNVSFVGSDEVGQVPAACQRVVDLGDQRRPQRAVGDACRERVPDEVGQAAGPSAGGQWFVCVSVGLGE